MRSSAAGTFRGLSILITEEKSVRCVRRQVLAARKQVVALRYQLPNGSLTRTETDCRLMQPTMSGSSFMKRMTVTAVNRINPITDPRWLELLQSHPHASIFHTPGWLEALRRTYEYQAVAFTTAAAGQELAFRALSGTRLPSSIFWI